MPPTPREDRRVPDPQSLRQAFTTVGEHHQDEPDIAVTCAFLARGCAAHVSALERLVTRYDEGSEEEAEAIYKGLFHGPRSGGVGLLRTYRTSICSRPSTTLPGRRCAKPGSGSGMTSCPA